MPKYMLIKMPDGSEWAVCVSTIAGHRAAAFAHEFDGSTTKSLDEDTLPLFSEDNRAISDWAENNMGWAHFAGFQILIRPSEADYDDGLTNGEKRFVERL
ncbi:MAG: hypothetical protein KKC18_14385 [Chloroflexi bacterium]|nr:hypothetical protein [Chloroflexota bacterium]